MTNTLKKETSLKRQTISGIAWTLTDVVLLRGSSFVAQLVLARLLGPAEFGLMGMIAVFVAIGTTIVDSGLTSSLIRTKDADERDYSTIFFTNVVVSIIVYCIIFLFAPLIADFYNQKILTSVIRIYCLTFIISSLSAVQIAFLIKRMDFRKIMVINIPGTVLGISTGVYLATSNYGVWSIVWMYLATQSCQSLMLWMFAKWWPSLIFSFPRLKHHFHFGYKLLLSGILNVTFENVYNVIIGKFYSAKLLGYYERAYMFNQYPVTTLTGIIDKVTYPMLSNIKDQQERVSIIYKRILMAAFFVSAPLMLGAAAIAHPLFLLVLGEEWIPAAPFFQILCLASIFYPIHAFNINILKVYGRSDLFLKLEILKKGLILMSVIIAFQFGIYGLLWSSPIVSFGALILNTHFSSSIIHYSIKQQLGDMLPTFLIAFFTSVLMFGLLLLLSFLPLLFQVLITSLFGLGIYFFINHLLKFKSYTNLYIMIKDIKS